MPDPDRTPQHRTPQHRAPQHRPVLRVLVVLGLLLLPIPGAAARATAPDPVPVGVWPLSPESEVVSGFDPPLTRYGAGHRGVDLAGHPGQPVRTALPGTVSYAGPVAGRGVVVVAHGGTRTTYEPVTASVRTGDRVTAGEQIGSLALVGSHCFPRACLHWGWLAGAAAYRDPLRLVGGGPVRLLPLHGVPRAVAPTGQRREASPSTPRDRRPMGRLLHVPRPL